MDRKIGYFVDMDTGCHICFTHRCDRNGYPQIKVRGRTRNVHRVLYESKYGEIEKGLEVRHRCDNPACINIRHLELGSHFDNVQDMVQRGRNAKGSKNGRAKLTEEIVLQILKSEQSNSDLSKQYGVTISAIEQIRQRKTWKHVSNEYYRVFIEANDIRYENSDMVSNF